MQFARNMPQRRFLRRNQLLRQFAALLRKRRQLRKNPRFAESHTSSSRRIATSVAVRNKIHLPLHAIVNLIGLRRRFLLFSLFSTSSRVNVVLNAACRAQQRIANLLAAPRPLLPPPAQTCGPSHPKTAPAPTRYSRCSRIPLRHREFLLDPQCASRSA